MPSRTKTILSYFKEINTIPRCSHNEQKVCQWLQHWATERQLTHRCDKAGNLVVEIPASPGCESAPKVVLQGHMDMVCEKTPDSKHDFSKDPIQAYMEGDWLTAKDTTLGADNGIAIGYMLTLADDPSLIHPPMELLFTVDEETGLNGAKALQPDFVQGRMLVNLDSEDEGTFTIGCAGGVDTTLSFDFGTQALPSHQGQAYQIVVGGLKGGHSGIDIHKQRGNANKIMVRVLARIAQRTTIQMVSILGGSRKNAIPRDARAIIAMDASNDAMVRQAVAGVEADIKREYAKSDPSLDISFGKAPSDTLLDAVINIEDTVKTIQLLLALPDGVAGMSADMHGLVETSNNLAIVRLQGGKLSLVSSQRSAAMSRMEEITNQVHAVAQLFGAQVKDHDAYPAWQPDMASALLTHSKEIYSGMFGRQPKIQVIHAGLECAVIGDLYPGMDMISFGPTIRNPHSPDERLWVPSVEQVWAFLVALLKTLAIEAQ